ncbi:MAG: thiamine pyrophosphate-binding protein [Propionibacteriaceae bacterium]|nr:thiamine pyrophosphate-binding protein [Propionibacteriaceae bacterium]
MTVPRRVAAAIAPHIHHVFGLMGNGNAHVIDALRELGVPFTALRHEAGTVAAADTYWRASRCLAVATTTYGAGYTNTLTALAEAAQARIPLILLTGGEPLTGPRPWDVDQAAIAKAVGAAYVRVGSEEPADAVHQAIRTALGERLPVVLDLPYDLTRAESPTGPLPEPGVLWPEGVVPDQGAVGEAARVLSSAQRPVILAGRGAHDADASPALTLLADAVGALTAETALARGLFAESQHHLGVTGGFGHEQAMALFREADVVVAAGASLSQFTMRFGELLGPEAKLIQIDDAPAPTNPRVDLHVLGDARLAAEALLDALGPVAIDSGWLGRATQLQPRQRDAGVGVCADGRLDPRSVSSWLAELLPANRVVVTDGGHFIGWPNTHWPVVSPERMIMVGTAYQTIGLGFPSAVGAAMAIEGATVVLATGDGGGLMALADLESVVRACPSAMVVVFNDAAYGAEVHLYGEMGLDQGPMRIPEVDFAAVGEALGATGIVVQSPADLDAVRRWVEAGARGAVVVDCRISSTVVADHQREIQRINGVIPKD